MKSPTAAWLPLLVMGLSAGVAAGQTQPEAAPANQQFDKPVQAIGYRVGGGATKIALVATGAIPEAHGEAKVEAKTGATYHRGGRGGPDAANQVRRRSF